MKTLNYLKHFLISICNKKIKSNFLSTDYFFGVLNSGKIKMSELFIYLDSISSDKSIELCIHPSNEIYENNITNKKISEIFCFITSSPYSLNLVLWQ